MPRPRAHSLSPSTNASSIFSPTPEYGYRHTRFSPYFSPRISNQNAKAACLSPQLVLSTSTSSVVALSTSSGSDASISSVSAEEEEGDDIDGCEQSKSKEMVGWSAKPKSAVRAPRYRSPSQTLLANRLSGLAVSTPASNIPVANPRLSASHSTALTASGRRHTHRRTQSLTTPTYGYLIASPRAHHAYFPPPPRSPAISAPHGGNKSSFPGSPTRPHSVPQANSKRRSRFGASLPVPDFDDHPLHPQTPSSPLPSAYFAQVQPGMPAGDERIAAQQMMLLNPVLAAHLKRGGSVAMLSVDGQRRWRISLPIKTRVD